MCIIFCLGLVFVISTNYSEAQTSQQITKELMQNYSQAFIDEYIIESNQYFPSKPINLTFYSDTYYNITFYSSSQGGAALLIEPSTASSFQVVSSSERIETAVFGGDLNLGGLFKGWVTNLLIDGVFLDNWGDRPVINLLNQSDAVVKQTSVNRYGVLQYFFFVDIKTSNETDHWTTLVARERANWLLYQETGQRFPQSAEFQRLLAESVLTQLLQDIQNKLKLEDYTFSDYLVDLQHVKDVASQYGITSEYLNELIEFMNAKQQGILPTFLSETPPSFKILIFTVEDPSNWLYVLFLCTFSSLGIISLVVFYDAKNKHPSKYVRVLLLILTGFFSLVVVNLVEQPPSNYQVVSLQTLVLYVFIFGVIGIGLFLVYKNKEKSRNVVVANDKGKK